MRRLLSVLPFLLLSCSGPPLTGPLAIAVTERHGILAEGPSQVLHLGWLAQPVGDVYQVERAYCVTDYESITRAGIVLYLVTSIGPAIVIAPTPNGIGDISCGVTSRGLAMPTVHTHPASSCNILGLCVADSSRMAPAWCRPSDRDRLTVLERKVPFSIVQCSATSWAFY